MLKQEQASSPNNLDAFWMPFTANRDFKKNPRMLVSAEGVHLKTQDGRDILDTSSGLWCSNAGHGHPRIVEAIQRQAATLDFAPAFQWGHPGAFELASRLVAEAPGDMDHVFFTNSGSESVDTALKIALAFHRVRGHGTRTRLIGRERGYHGVGFGGISVGGIVKNRLWFGSLLSGVDHLPHTLDMEHNAFTRGQPEWGAHLADELERIVALHDASNIAAVIVEPVAGSIGVYPPPVGYLQKLREITRKHGILLIFDEVITAFGRLGKFTGSEYFDVQPDIITTAKGLTSAAVPMGAVFVRKHIYDAFMASAVGEKAIELFHGYTYSAHPLACAAGIATLEVYKEEDLFARSTALHQPFEDAIHSLKGEPHVIDIRNIGLMGTIELRPRDGAPSERAYDVMVRAFDKGALLRVAGDSIALSPPLVSEERHIEQAVDIIRACLREVP